MDNANEVLGKMAGLVTANTKTMSMLGARAMVLGAFFDAALPHLSTSQRAEVARSFRQGVEDAMAQMDDVALPAEYHSVLLGLTNTILAALGRETATRQ
ncbi:hypothetical protein [Paraburkholderia lacunae]|uniref:Uncharacterized protein n=1 Tax=Paraburkholderia lacunae TaxID=2211104 RepID=A0A370MZJ4_9BURK|nr:hypothetical protein [Paraburkholderia lacunae]RDJ98789.1 hypothetical protein DLM46_32165 [Paraburkholderia lacunae]